MGAIIQDSQKAMAKNSYMVLRTKRKICQNSEIQFWLNRISQGDDVSFWSLWIYYREDLYRFCLRWMGNNPIDAEDILSQAMLVAREKLKKYAHTMKNLKAWLIRLTHNLCIDAWRVRKKEFNADVLEMITGTDSEPFLSTLDRPDSLLLQNELGMLIARSIENLPERLQRPFVLKFCCHCSYQEIAARLSITYATARKRIQEARTILKREMAQYEYS